MPQEQNFTSTRGPARADRASSTATYFDESAGANSEQNTQGRRLSDDEILGIGADESLTNKPIANDSLNGERKTAPLVAEDPDVTEQPTEGEAPEKLRAALNANPELRQAWEEARAYREAFATPTEAREAVQQLAELKQMDTLFFSRKPEDHDKLARLVAEAEPAAFASLAEAMGRFAADLKAHEAEARGEQPQADLRNVARVEAWRGERDRSSSAAPIQAQTAFLQATNAAAVQSIMEAIEGQVARLLPEKTSQGAKNRVVGEIYRELDSALQGNGQFTRQVREAFRSGALDAAHQRAVVTMITGRARQALPSVAKRVLGEWTSTVVAASQDRRERQRAAEKRVDIAGASRSGGEGRRTMTPRDIDYARMSDGDILNL